MKAIPVWILLFPALLAAGMTCKDSKPADAKATTRPGAVSPVPSAIIVAKTEAQAALDAVEKKVQAAQAQLAALEKRASVAAAQVESIRTANTNQPAGPATTVVAGEAFLALANLPPPDVTAALEAEKRRAATFAGQVDEARRLYAAAQTETERMKAEADKLRGDAAAAKAEADSAKAKADAAHVSLVASEKAHAATLEKNRAENQAKIDAAEKRASEAEEKAQNERHKLIFRALLGLGLACIAGAIAMAVLTSGAMLMKSLMLAGGGALCIGVAQIVSHPWFDRVFGTCVGVAVVGAVFYLWHERKDAIKRIGFEKTVGVLGQIGDLSSIPVRQADGKESNLAMELSRSFGDAEKVAVRKVKLANAIKEAKSL